MYFYKNIMQSKTIFLLLQNIFFNLKKKNYNEIIIHRKSAIHAPQSRNMPKMKILCSKHQK